MHGGWEGIGRIGSIVASCNVHGDNLGSSRLCIWHARITLGIVDCRPSCIEDPQCLRSTSSPWGNEKSLDRDEAFVVGAAEIDTMPSDIQFGRRKVPNRAFGREGHLCSLVDNYLEGYQSS